MTFVIQPMSREAAETITTWKYDAPYDFYNAEEGPECIAELCNGDYYQILDPHSTLIGFCCCGRSAQIPAGIPQGVYADDRPLDIGIGMKPSLTGNGAGRRFFDAILSFLGDTSETTDFRLTVAAWNRRAIRIYEQAGFRPVQAFETDYGEFQVMACHGREQTAQGT